LTTHITTSLRPFHVVAGSTALTIVPVCYEPWFRCYTSRYCREY